MQHNSLQWEFTEIGSTYGRLISMQPSKSVYTLEPSILNKTIMHACMQHIKLQGKNNRMLKIRHMESGMRLLFPKLNNN